MPAAVQAAFIAFAGVLASAFVSWLIAKRQVSGEIQRLRYELETAYGQKLQEKRIAIYPDLFAILSEYTKRIQANDATHDLIKSVHAQLEQWHTKNGLFLTAQTFSIAYRFRRVLRNMVSKSDEAFAARLADAERRRQLIRDAWELELGLRNDLGIFEVEFFEPGRRFKSYLEVDEVLGID